PAALAPHAELPRYYTRRQKSSFVRRIFDRTACDYDRIERLMALGTGGRYRREALLRAGLRAGMRVLDVAAGTGAVAREAIAIVQDPSRVTGIDPSSGMLAELKRELPIHVVQGTGERLPLADKQFDFLSIGYALRHLSDLPKALGEFRRVLKPGGVLCILEITAPDRPLPRLMAQAYFKAIVPCLTRLVARHPDTQLLWRYYWDTIDACIPPGRVLQAITDAGFAHAKRHVELGLFSEYTATRSVDEISDGTR
ncbi:MAG TPA: class I SAM-dependent methyltransferase, partial [Tepidisphaeraceae bacterium]|nr:class I SAM-dependent methyltransferase [Tepidisphaeraceae bacterium]